MSRWDWPPTCPECGLFMKQDNRITCGKAKCKEEHKIANAACVRACGLSSDTLDHYAWQERNV